MADMVVAEDPAAEEEDEIVDTVRAAEDGRMYEWCFACAHDGTEERSAEVQELITALEAACGEDNLILKDFPCSEVTWMVLVSCPEFLLRKTATKMKLKMKVKMPFDDPATATTLKKIGGSNSRRRDCHFNDTPCLSLLKHLIHVQGVPSNDSLADG